MYGVQTPVYVHYKWKLLTSCMGGLIPRDVHVCAYTGYFPVKPQIGGKFIILQPAGHVCAPPIDAWLGFAATICPYMPVCLHELCSQYIHVCGHVHVRVV